MIYDRCKVQFHSSPNSAVTTELNRDARGYPENYDTLPALLVRFYHNLADFSNSNNDFCCFLTVITRYYDGPYTLLETG
jgi:hypothetical protein